MKKVFADTSYWIGLIVLKDQLHKRAVVLTEQLADAQFVTSEMVLAELFNAASRDRDLRESAAELVDDFRRNRGGIIVAQTAGQFDGALQLYKQVSDKAWSLKDCASFLIMEEMGIQEALTHDQHFVQAGFEALLR